MSWWMIIASAAIGVLWARAVVALLPRNRHWLIGPALAGGFSGWCCTILCNTAGTLHLSWWLLLAPIWVGGVVVALLVIVGVGFGMYRQVCRWAQQRQRDRERRELIRSMESGFLDGRGLHRKPKNQ